MVWGTFTTASVVADAQTADSNKQGNDMARVAAQQTAKAVPNSRNVEDEAIATLMQAILAEQPYSGLPIACLGPTYVALRRGGRLQRAYWWYDSELYPLLDGVVEQALSLVAGGNASDAAHATPFGIDAIELCLTHSYQLVDPSEFGHTFANLHWGMRGIEMQYQGRLYRYSPTQMIAANTIERFPAQPVLYLINGQALNNLNQSDDAIEILSEGVDYVIEDNQMLSDFYKQLAIACTNTKQSGKAAEYNKMAQELLAD